MSICFKVLLFSHHYQYAKYNVSFNLTLVCKYPTYYFIIIIVGWGKKNADLLILNIPYIDKMIPIIDLLLISY